MARGLPLILLLAAVAGCGGDGDESSPSAVESGPVAEDPGAVHVHGLGVNPKDGALFIATHTGLFRAPRRAEAAKRVANRYQDTMGFTVIGPDRFLGSGHPDGREELPPFLGLIRSDDAGRSWREVSLMGEVDFHVLEASGRHVYGFGSNYETRRPTFLVSADQGRSWQERRAPGAIVSLAISPNDPRHVVAAIDGGPAAGLHESVTAGKTWRPVAERLGHLAWTPDALMLAELDGSISESRDDGRSWEEAGEVGGEPAAFDAGAGGLYAALHDGTVKRSGDGGRTWKVRSRPQPVETAVPD